MTPTTLTGERPLAENRREPAVLNMRWNKMDDKRANCETARRVDAL